MRHKECLLVTSEELELHLLTTLSYLADVSKEAINPLKTFNKSLFFPLGIQSLFWILFSHS